MQGLRVDSPVTPGVGGVAVAKPANCTQDQPAEQGRGPSLDAVALSLAFRATVIVDGVPPFVEAAVA